MRKNSVRKWLHAVLDFLPLLVIPIFAIYTRNENYNSNIEVQTYENKVVDFNQDFNDENANKTRLNYDDHVYTANAKSQLTAFYQYQCIEGHKYLCKCDFNFSYNNNVGSYTLQFNLNGQYVSTSVASANDSRVGSFENIISKNNNFDNQYIGIVVWCSNSDVDLIGSTISYVQIFDLTQMFGANNEPTLQEFNTYFENTYYYYTTSSQYMIPNYVLETYNDTDVGSQFVYTLYNVTDKYFNCTNLFNLGQVWNWVQLNLFGGNAPLMVYVVWQVIVYEFFMDLIFLLYSVFMFIIDFATNCIDRFTGRANRC